MSIQHACVTLTTKLSAILFLLTIFALPATVIAASFTVNSLADNQDAAPGNGICADSANKCTLRAAIQEANAWSGDDRIEFNLNQNSTVLLTAALPSLSTNIVIDNGNGTKNLTVRRNTGGDYRIFGIANSANVTISGLIITNGKLPPPQFRNNYVDGGGGIRNDGTLKVLHSTLSENSANGHFGDGIYNRGSLHVSNAKLTRTSTSRSALYNEGTAVIVKSYFANNVSGVGAGVWNKGNVTVLGSTFTANSADGAAALYNQNQMVLINSTISGNLNAGAVVNENNSGVANLNVINCTIANNHNTGIANFSGVVNVRNSIIAGNNQAASAVDVSGSFNSQGHNFIGNGSSAYGFSNGVNNDKVGTAAAQLDPMLGPLQVNGGQIETRALKPGSPAIDAGNDCVLSATCQVNNPSQPVVTDTRGDGFARSIGSSVDIGAFEVQGLDSDEDGIADVNDNCPSQSNPEQFDNDRDGLGDVCDADDDNDGVVDTLDAFPFDPTETVDTDGDGVGNNADPDDDNDNILDNPDNCDLTANPDQADFDRDGVGDVCDPQTGPARDREQCRNNGWRRFNFPRAFRNQTDCVLFTFMRR